MKDLTDTVNLLKEINQQCSVEREEADINLKKIIEANRKEMFARSL